MKKLICILGGLLAIRSTGLFASITAMNASEIKNALIDKTITTIPVSMIHGKTIFNTYRAYFSKDGKCVGQFAKRPDEWPQSDKGTWRAKDDGMLCFTWEHWSNSEEVCVAFYKLSNGILIVTRSNGFDTFILDNDIQSGNKLLG